MGFEVRKMQFVTLIAILKRNNKGFQAIYCTVIELYFTLFFVNGYCQCLAKDVFKKNTFRSNINLYMAGC